MNLTPAPVTVEGFAPFGQLIATGSDHTPQNINAGTCVRHDDLGRVAADDPACVGFSIFNAEPQNLPLELRLFERHPLGSQAFIPMGNDPFCIVVAPACTDASAADAPELAKACAFICQGQAVNIGRNVWHHPLIALGSQSRFWVVDRVGSTDNLEIFELPEPATLQAA